MQQKNLPQFKKITVGSQIIQEAEKNFFFIEWIKELLIVTIVRWPSKF